jgi:ATP-dependent DNA helicase RecG
LDRVVNAMQSANLTAPQFQETAGTFRVALSNQPATGHLISPESMPDLSPFQEYDLNPRQEQAVQYIALHKRITNKDYQDLCPQVHAETLRRDLADLVRKGILLKVGSKRGTHYIFKGK